MLYRWSSEPLIITNFIAYDNRSRTQVWSHHTVYKISLYVWAGLWYFEPILATFIGVLSLGKHSHNFRSFCSYVKHLFYSFSRTDLLMWVARLTQHWSNVTREVVIFWERWSSMARSHSITSWSPYKIRPRFGLMSTNCWVLLMS